MQLLVQRTKNKLCGNVHNFHTKVSLVANNRREGNWTETVPYQRMIPILSLSPNLITLRRICQGFALELSSLHPELISSPQTVRANAERERETALLLGRPVPPPTHHNRHHDNNNQLLIYHPQKQNSHLSDTKSFKLPYRVTSPKIIPPSPEMIGIAEILLRLS